MGKNMKRILMLLFTIMLSIPLAEPVKAKTINETDKTVIYDTNIPVPSEIYGMQRVGAHTVLTKISSGTKYNVDSGYHPQTNVWRKVSAYNFNTSYTTDITVSFTGGERTLNGTIGISQTTAQSFGYTVSADQSRFSKIRVYTSFEWTYYKAELIDDATGNLLNTYYFTSLNKTHEEFRPVYQ